MLSENKVQIGIIEQGQAERLRSKLAAKDIPIVLIHNPQSCKKGCSGLSVEAWTEEKHLPEIAKEFKEQRDELLKGLNFDVEQVNQVHDDSKEEATCPACGTNFSSSMTECPDCGLMFSALS